MPAVQINIEFWLRLLYDCMRGACYQSVTAAQFSAWLARLWLSIIVIGYVLSIIGFFIIVYVIIRLFELRRREKAHYRTLLSAPGTAASSPRWQHIESLAGGTHASEWREAIIEADIMLDELLAQRGYGGDGVGERLKSIEPGDFSTLQDAWEAHKVRNQIAHEGSAFPLSETIVHRTIARYESVFRELGAI